jgi:predicted secreted protein
MAMVKTLAAMPLAALAVALLVASAAIAAGIVLFGMSVPGAIALYFVVWWVLLFAVLPFGVRSQAEDGAVVAGTEPGAPSAPLLVEKAIWTTIVADVVFVGAAAVLPLAGL